MTYSIEVAPFDIEERQQMRFGTICKPFEVKFAEGWSSREDRPLYTYRSYTSEAKAITAARGFCRNGSQDATVYRLTNTRERTAPGMMVVTVVAIARFTCA